MIELSVIVCTYNRSEYLPALFNSLAGQTLPAEKYEVVIIDNNSNDDTASLSKDFIKENPGLNIHYHIEYNPGLSFARNRGIKESAGNVLIFIDDDANASRQYLQSIAEYFRDHPEAEAGGGKIIPDYEKSEPGWMTPYLLPVVSALDLGETIRPFPDKKYPIGANMFFRKEVFERIGTFNTDLGRKGSKLMGGEEKDIFLRMGEDSVIIYLPEAAVYHFVPEKRLQKDYLRNMALGVGKSEITRIKSHNGKLSSAYRREIIKWAGSIVLFFMYLVKFQYSKGRMLIYFRYFVSKGMLTGLKE